MTFKLLVLLLLSKTLSLDVGGGDDDLCETKVTDVQGYDGKGLIIGGGTTSPMFVAKLTGDLISSVLNADCFDNMVPFLYQIDDFGRSPHDIDKYLLFDEYSNGEYSEIGSIHKGYKNNDPTLT